MTEIEPCERKYLEALKRMEQGPLSEAHDRLGRPPSRKDLPREGPFRGARVRDGISTSIAASTTVSVDYCRKHVNDEEILSYLSLSHQREIGKDTLLVFDEAQGMS